MNGILRSVRIVFAAVLGVCFAFALMNARALELPGVFSDHMVLQQGRPLPIWGRGAPGEKVRVQLGDAIAETNVTPDGNWQVRLPARAASAEPLTLTVTAGNQSVQFRDVLVGEVWLCSGQSNMDWTVGQCLDGDLEALAGSNPQIRLLRLERIKSTEPQFTNPARWSVAGPESVRNFSAVGWHFGKFLQQSLGVPVGLIDAAWGGTPAIAWTRPEVFPKHELLENAAAEWEKGMPTFRKDLAEWEKAAAEYRKAKGLAEDTFLAPWKYRDAPQRPPHDPDSPNRPGVLARGMLSAIAPYALRGVIWYQGETDAEWEPRRYHERIAVMFGDWREWWGISDLPIGIVQLANYLEPKTEVSDDPWPNLRESQRKFAANDPHAGIVSALDAGEIFDIHPRDKQVIGRRLARWALADVYQKLTLRGGPEPVSAEFSDVVRIKFDSVGSGLAARAHPPLRGFTLAGEDGIFHEAEAEITGQDSVVVRSAEVPAPVAVRYAWQNNPVEANLINQERLPAPGFELRKNP